jgi:hypothetical protein
VHPPGLREDSPGIDRSTMRLAWVSNANGRWRRSEMGVWADIDSSCNASLSPAFLCSIHHASDWTGCCKRGNHAHCHRCPDHSARHHQSHRWTPLLSTSELEYELCRTKYKCRTRSGVNVGTKLDLVSESQGSPPFWQGMQLTRARYGSTGDATRISRNSCVQGRAYLNSV